MGASWSRRNWVRNDEAANARYAASQAALRLLGSPVVLSHVSFVDRAAINSSF